MGFAVIAVPTAAILLATTSITDLYEQVIWYPIVGPRQFRGLPSQEIISPAAFELFVIVVVLLRRL